MKKNWMKKLCAALCAATLFASGLAVTVNAANEKIKPFGLEDYQNLVKPDMTISKAEDLVGDVNITKRIADPSQTSFAGTDSELPVNNVQFTMTKVGDYAVVEDEKGNPSVMIGIHEDVLTAIGYKIPDAAIKGTGSTPTGNGGTEGYVYLTSGVYNNLNKDYLFVDNSKEQKFDISAFDTAIENYQKNPSVNAITETTGQDETNAEDGIAKFHSVPFGIYVVRETNVYDAVTVETVNEEKKEERVYFSKKQHPYLISIPASVDNKWTDTIDVNAKNDTEPVDLDKLIVRNSNYLSGDAGTNETDVTHIGDTVEFQLKTEVPALDPTQLGDKIENYVINDVISKGLTLPDFSVTANISVKDSAGNVYFNGTDFDVFVDGNVYDAENEAVISDEGFTADEKTVAYLGGNSFRIVFKENGLKRLTTLAKNGSFENYILVNYVAKVNADAVVGEVGNPNKVQLVYRAAGSHNIGTGWEEVWEFIFEMEGTKYFDGKAFIPTEGETNPNNSVEFELYQSTNGGEKKLVKFSEVKDANGVVTGYLYNPEGAVTELKPANDGKFHITGLPVFDENIDTFYLRETATAPGYNKITEDIEITLVAANKTDTGKTDEYTGLLSQEECKVNAKTPSLNAGDTGITFTVNNTSGFQLPSTGGMGIWMFVIGGMAVIGCGLLYYRRNKSAE